MSLTTDYNPQVPQKGDAIAKSQLDFLINFSTLYTAFGKNHIDLDVATIAGNHTVIELPEQDANFQSDVGEISVYSKDVKGQTDQIFLKYQGTAAEFQFTNYQLYTLKSTTPPTQFFTFLPGKVIMYFGSIRGLVTPSNGSPLQLVLSPKIAKNIITINLVPEGDTPQFIPRVVLQTPDKDTNIYSTIDLHAPNSPGYRSTFYYVVLANI